VREAILAQEMERDLDPPDGQDMSTELDKAHTFVDRIVEDYATKAEQLSRQVIQVADILIHLGLLPIEDIPQLLKRAQEVLPAVALIPKHLQEARDSSAGPLD
jgi:hypothetical protein